MVASTVPPLEGVAMKYMPTLDSLLSFVHKTEYTRRKDVHKGKLHALTPENVLHWMNIKTAWHTPQWMQTLFW
jgi:hypothetical protein